MRWFNALLILALATPASAQALEKKRPDPEVIEDKTPRARAVPVYSGATVNIIRNLKQQVPDNDSCCWPPWDKSCCFHPQTGKW
jgi:hypothetical protein